MKVRVRGASGRKTRTDHIQHQQHERGAHSCAGEHFSSTKKMGGRGRMEKRKLYKRATRETTQSPRRAGEREPVRVCQTRTRHDQTTPAAVNAVCSCLLWFVVPLKRSRREVAP